MEHYPFISVVIPTKNESKNIVRLINSIKKQTYKNFEILIGDYSTDDTPVICKNLGAKVFRAKRPGPSAGRNIALKHAKGDIIAFIDADLILGKNTFKKVVDVFLKNKDVVVVKTLFVPIWSEVPKEKRTAVKIANYLNNLLIKNTDFLKGKLMTYACVFCRADAVRKVGYFNENINIAEDADFYQRLGKYGKFMTINERVGFSYRRFIKKGMLKTILFYIKGVIKTELLRENKDELEEVRI
ncbi:MAG: glycosyltransferase family 2 protein [Candidatus Rehaiarchaeum fermentans]|nr:glycosyltransferase [Candidatus Rehaiarchaeum fermentans]